MAITYPLTPPATPGFSRFALKHWNIVAVTQSEFTGERQTQEHTGEGWKAECTYVPMKRAQAAPILAFLASLRAALGTFHLGPSYAKTPLGVATEGAGAQVAGVGSPPTGPAARSKTLPTTGWTPNITGILLAGDFVQVGSGVTRRLYENLKDVNSDAEGSCTLDIFPRLREGLTIGAAITKTNCQGTFCLSGEPQIDCDEGRIFHIAFSAIEAL